MAVLGVLMFLILSMATNLLGQVRDPFDVGLAIGGLLATLVVGVLSTVLLRRLPRSARVAFATAVAVCVALGLAAGGPLDVVPSPWLLAVPDMFVRGTWSMASWLLLGASAVWAATRAREPITVKQ